MRYSDKFKQQVVDDYNTYGKQYVYTNYNISRDTLRRWWDDTFHNSQLEQSKAYYNKLSIEKKKQRIERSTKWNKANILLLPRKIIKHILADLEHASIEFCANKHNISVEIIAKIYLHITIVKNIEKTIRFNVMLDASNG
jgi:transposase-like protein